MKKEISKFNEILDVDENIDIKLSYSKLSDFDRNGGKSLIRESSLDNNGLKFGSLVDDLLFNDRLFFEERYYIFDGEKPTATLGLLCNVIFNNYLEIPKNKEEVLEIVKNNDFWSNTKKKDLLIEKFNTPDFWGYIKCIYEVKDRVIITTADYDKAMNLVNILNEHKYSKDILINDYEKLYQFRFEFEYKLFEIRGVLDIISIDHKNKKVYFTDLKTGADPAIEFENSFIKWRYYIQGAIYSLAYKEIFNKLNLKGYRLMPFQFLYISNSDKTPLLYIMTDKWMKAAILGFKIGKYKYKGINELIDEIYWCWKNKEYNIPKIIVENNGIVELKDNYIEINE